MTAKEYNRAVKELSGRLYRYVVKFLRDEEASQDIVQDSFMKLWLSREKVLEDKIKPWLFTTAHNALINYSKREQRKESLEYNNYKEPTADPNRYELREIIDQSLSRLNEMQRSIILLRDLEGYNYKEIGEILHLNESQVKVYLFRARQKVKNLLKDTHVLS